MSKRNSIYRCALCGNIVELEVVGGGTLVCCGKPMTLQDENTTEAAVEKHVPVLTPIAGGYKVTVGSVAHPMVDAHYIQWIELLAGQDVLRRFLKPGEAPEATFLTAATAVTARAYCNLHGFWKA
ncbi:MAG: desulfoferrodoxin [Pseudomonadota bacterium]